MTAVGHASRRMGRIAALLVGGTLVAGLLLPALALAAGPPDAGNSTITGTSPVTADGSSASAVTITLNDASNSPVAGVTPTFTATGSNNTYGACSVSDSSGVSTCTLASTTAQVKTLSIATPVVKAGGSVTFDPGPFTRLQLLVPGEAAAPGTATGKTGSALTQTVGVAFNVTVNAVDANWNLVSAAADNIGITSSDGAAVLPPPATLSGGTRPFSITLVTAPSQTVTATDLTDGTKAAATSPVIALDTFIKLVVLLPGESLAANATCRSGSPTAQTVGTAFTVTVDAVDASCGLVGTVADTVHLTSSDGNAVLPSDAALVGGTKTFSVTLQTAGPRTIAASDVTNPAKTAGTSSSVTVSAGSFTKLQLLVPGETAAPGTATGKTGSPLTQTVGVAFTVTVNAVDANWNPVSSTHTIHLTSTDGSATLPADAPLVAGTRTFSVTLRTTGRTITASDATDGTKTADTSPAITLDTFVKLQILLPGESLGSAPTCKSGSPTAQTAGTAFNVTVDAVDTSCGFVNTVVDTVAITSSDLNAVLPASAPLSGGTKTFSVTLKTAGARTVTASDATNPAKTSSTSSSVTVNPGPYAKLQLLVPGESAAPGTATGKTGSPLTQTVGVAFTVTVNGVDANWNLVSTAPNDNIGITSSDGSATLPANATLSGGTRSFSVTLRTTGRTVTATDLTDSTKTASTSPAISLSTGGPTVTINQASGQADPTSTSPINFTVVFSVTVSGFTGTDVTITGTAGGSKTVTVTGSGPTYNAAVTGMTTAGTVVANIAAGVATATSGGLPNLGSTSSDNTVTWSPSGPTVTINQAAGQADPTSTSPINFTVVFSQSVTGFTTGDVTISGTAGGTKTGTVTGSGTTYNVAVTGMTSAGTVVATIGAGVAVDGSSRLNLASTSTDNVVTWTAAAASITVTPSASTITWGGTVILTTRFAANGANRTFQLWGARDNRSPSNFALIATLTTNSNGISTFAYTPVTNLYYKAVFGGASGIGAGTSPETRVVVRQIAVLRPTNSGSIKSISRGTTITFTTTVRPSRPELTPASVTYWVYHKVSGAWQLFYTRNVTASAAGLAKFTWQFSSSGLWYVRSMANPTPYNANSVKSPVEQYKVS